MGMLYLYSFRLEAESTPGPIVRPEVLCYYDTFGNRTRDLPASSAVPQPTAPPAACRLLGLLTFLIDINVCPLQIA